MDDLKTILNDTAPCRAKWYNLGIQLRVDMGTLESIELQYKAPGDQLREVVKAWLKSVENPTWGAMIDALKSPDINETRLASKLQQKYCFSGQTPADEVEAVAVSPPAIPPSDSAAVVVIKCNIERIEGKFAYLVTTTCKHLQRRGVDVDDMLTFLIAKLSSPNSTDGNHVVITVVESATTLRGIFRALSKHRLWDYHNYYLLQVIVENFGHDDHELDVMMEQYQEAFVSHILVQKLAPFLDAVTSFSGENSTTETVRFSELFKDLTVKVGVDITEHSLLYVEELWNFLTHQVSLPRPALILRRFAKGCISITWHVPTNLVEYVKRMTQEKSNVFADRTDLHILRVVLDGQCIYPVKVESSLPGTIPQRKQLPVPHMMPVYKSTGGMEKDLMEAAKRGNMCTVTVLIQHGATVNFTDKDGWTALHLAAQEGHEDVVDLLLETMANPDLKTKVISI